ncbi:MAG: hypothetical protein WCK77_15735 [Verrucomicrobiota bacterium]
MKLNYHVCLAVIGLLCAIITVKCIFFKLTQTAIQNNFTPATEKNYILRSHFQATTHRQLNSTTSKDDDDETLLQHNLAASRFDTEVSFFGIVIDQDGAPVENATINASVTTLRLVKTDHGVQEYTELMGKSATDGTFKLQGEAGMYLDIESLGKVGYVLPSDYQAGTRWPGAKYHYRYRAMGPNEKTFTPSRSHPEIFHLWKLNKPESLVIHGSLAGTDGPEFQIGSPAKALTLSGRFGSNLDELGLARDVTITVTDVGTPQSPRWEVTASAFEADGGIIMANSSDVFLFHAPESGYSHSISIRYGPEGADEMNDESGVPFRFYMRSKGGRWHSAVEFVFFAPDQHGKVATRMRFWMNPNSSRNLEHDGAHPSPPPILTR